jgi:hypothetical protein
MRQIVGDLGPDRVSGREVADRFLAPRQLLQAPGQVVVEPDVARVPTYGLSQHDFGRRRIARVAQGRS